MRGRDQSGHMRTAGAFGVECLHCGLRPHWAGWASGCVPMLRAPSPTGVVRDHRRNAIAQRVRDAARRAAWSPEDQHAHREAMRLRMHAKRATIQ